MAAPAQFYDCSRVDSAAFPPAPCQVLLPIVPASAAAAPNHQNHTHSQTIPDQNVAKNTEKQSRNIYARCSCALERRWFSPAGVGGSGGPATTPPTFAEARRVGGHARPTLTE